MNPGFRHILLTRFSVALSGNRFRERAWLNKRFDLFERFCFPSVEGQSSRLFEWFVFFDSSLPEDLRARVAGYSRCSTFRAVYVRGPFGGDVVRDALRDLSSSCKYLITSRLDNDDSLAKHYIQTVQSQFNEQSFEFVNISNGYIFDGVRAYAHEHPSNPFISLIEQTDRFRSVLSFNHTRVSDHGQVQQVDHMPGWLIVVHGDNVCNTVSGTPVSTAVWKDYFTVPYLSMG